MLNVHVNVNIAARANKKFKISLYLWRHPVWSSNESVSSPNGSVKLRAHSEVDQLDLRIVGEENVLTFDVTVNDLASVEMGQSAKHLTKK